MRHFATINQDELLDLKRCLTLLHAELHNPGAARYIDQVDLDSLTDKMIYIINHCLANLSTEQEAA